MARFNEPLLPSERMPAFSTSGGSDTKDACCWAPSKIIPCERNSAATLG